MNLQIVNPLTHPGYDEMVLASGGSFFHTSFWARVLHDSYGYRPCYPTRVHNGTFAALLPLMEVRSFLTGRRGVSLPFTDYCDPIIRNLNDWPDMLEYLKEYGKNAKWKYLELRGGQTLTDQTPFSSFYYRHVLKLSPDVDTIYSHLKASTKRNIRKAVREGVSVARSNSLDAMKTFYHLHCLTRKKHGLPPQPFYFFHRLHDHVICRGRGQVVLAAYQGRTIAAAVYLHFGGEAIYKFGASDSKYLHLRPNDLVMWEAIQWYCRNGYTRFCFGRTDADDEGLRHYKSAWGAEEDTLKYIKYDLIKKTFMRGTYGVPGFHHALLRKMPVPLLKAAGSVLYRHMG